MSRDITSQDVTRTIRSETPVRTLPLHGVDALFWDAALVDSLHSQHATGPPLQCSPYLLYARKRRDIHHVRALIQLHSLALLGKKKKMFARTTRGYKVLIVNSDTY